VDTEIIYNHMEKITHMVVHVPIQKKLPAVLPVIT